MNKTNKKIKQLEEAISREFMEDDQQDAWFSISPIMESVFYWGMKNIPAKEIDKILAYHKKFYKN